MIALTLHQVADIVGGAPPDEGDEAVVTDVVIDSRRAGRGSLFVALPGERSDGHHHVADALARGAAGALVAEARLPEPVPAAVVVDDPADALLGLGGWVRDAVDPQVVAITGSQGKTTTKDLVAAAIGGVRATVANEGSYNNELGVPLTCCRLERDSEVLVSEVGARGIGHIAMLAQVLRPDVAVVTAVGASHLELLGDLDGVERAKGELVAALGVDGVAVLNGDDARVVRMARLAAGRTVTYGVGEGCDWRAVDARLDDEGRARFTAVPPAADPVSVALPVPGVHNVANALAALAVAEACGVDAERAAAGLADARVSRWRMEPLRRDDGLLVLNDAYNANPGSTATALDTLAALPRVRRWAALGLMAELGAAGPEAHREVGRRCAELGLDGLVVVGTEASGIAEGARAAGHSGALVEAADADEALDALTAAVGGDDVVLVKASRSVGLEALAAALAGGERR